jgi:microcystin-dependent protein
MANPQGYTVSYNFGAAQANNPATPLPGSQVDNELGNVSASIASIISALGSVRRSDGALVNGIVTFESLALGLQLTVDPTNGTLVANAVTGAQASATAASNSASAAATSATNAATSANAAATSASSVNLTLYLPKAGNLAGLGSLVTSRQNLGLGSVATFDAGVAANNIVQLDGSAKLPAVDGSQLINIDVLPVGTTIWTNGTVAPAGTLKENGALVSRTSFPRLWAFANSSNNIVSEATWVGGSTGAFSTGDLSTTFRLPDSRGEFFRALDDGRGVDSGRAMTTHQADSLKDHTHSYQYYGTNVRNDGTSALTVQSALVTGNTGSPSTGAAAETRPRNNVKLACIKY